MMIMAMMKEASDGSIFTGYFRFEIGKVCVGGADF